MPADSKGELLPNCNRAVVEIEKLRDYCLSPTHLRGRHKARVFQSRLGLTAADADWLRKILLKAARETPAEPGEKDEFGQRYVIDFEVTTGTATAKVRSGWIVLKGQEYPRLTSCFVK